MDFSNLKANVQANSVLSKIKNEEKINDNSKNASSILKGQQSQIKLLQGYDIYPKVYQGCSFKYNTEVIHTIIKDEVICLGCKGTYRI